MKPLSIISLPLGPMENNTYLIADPETNLAVVIDPSFESEGVLSEVARRELKLQAIWLTHAHFDHIAGVNLVANAYDPVLPVGLHPDDLALWQQDGGARLFGIMVEPGPEPSITFSHGQVLKLGEHSIEVRHTPGHTAGHVVFYAPSAETVICGDLIFYHGVGRTDLPGGNHAILLDSIRKQILTLPPTTRLLSGHGHETTVAEEIAENPFL